jgi:hypothetical protein
MFTTVAVLLVQSAEAYTVTLEQAGANVVANGSGAINLTGLTFGTFISTTAGIVPNSGFIGLATGRADGYFGYSGPSSFGSGSDTFASSSSGDPVGIEGVGRLPFLFVPVNYVSGTPISSSAIWNNATFASLGVTPGTYVWTWGTGLPNQNFTLIIGGAGVADGGSTISLLGFSLLSLAALRRKLRC